MDRWEGGREARGGCIARRERSGLDAGKIGRHLLEGVGEGGGAGAKGAAASLSGGAMLPRAETYVRGLLQPAGRHGPADEPKEVQVRCTAT